MDIKYIIFAIVIIIYAYRAITKTMRNAKEEAERRKKLNEEAGKSITTQPSSGKSIDEVLAEVFREVETKTKPFGQLEKPRQQKQKPFHEKKKVQSTAATMPAKPSVTKKEPVPFLTTDYTAQMLEPEGTPSHMMEDYIRKGQLTDVYNVKEKTTIRKINLREAVIASIVLQRPEW